MKKISILPLVFALLISNTLVFGQKSDTTAEKKKLLPYYIETCTDKMTDKSYAFGSKHLLCSDDGKKGFIVRVSWSNKDGEINYNGITVKSSGIGTCVENSTLIILFEDDTKVQISAWNKFNCEGNSYMDWQGKSFDKIFAKKAKAIRFQNGRSMDSFTYSLPEKDKSFFLEAGKALSEKRFVIASCND
jgi:hypothetical protein